MSDKIPANPDGKGGSPVLAGLDAARHGLGDVPAKPVDQIATELFTSLFVLESEFHFKPVAGKTYYLYQQPERFWLGLTPPAMLGEAVAGRFIGYCRLQPDLTWTLALAADVAADRTFTAWLAEQRRLFEARLEAAETVDDMLPIHESHMSFYRRAWAFGVAHSLSRSLGAAGLRGLSYDQARGVLPSSS